MPWMLEFETLDKAPQNVIFINAKSIHTVKPHYKTEDLTEISYSHDNYVVVREKCDDVVDRLRRAFELGEA
jgi:uncharacterized protein YlzI (FlbEa/FlbD family)